MIGRFNNIRITEKRENWRLRDNNNNDVNNNNNSCSNKNKIVFQTSSLESPFAWNIDDSLALSYDEDEELEVGFDEQPIIALVEATVKVFIKSRQNNLRDARDKMLAASKMLARLDTRQLEREGIALSVIEHIIASTGYFLKSCENAGTGNSSSMPTPKSQSEFASTIRDIYGNKDSSSSRGFESTCWWRTRGGEFISNNSKKIAEATLNGCKSIAWAMFHEQEVEKVIQLARMAIDRNPLCALWHFVLGKNLRRLRRDDGFGMFQTRPSREECQHFQIACSISRGDPYFGVFFAHLYRECKDFTRARRMFHDIFYKKPTSIGVNLRLALGLTRSRDFDIAQKCLDYVGSIIPNNSMYLHYRGIFYDKQKMYKEASKFLYKAGKLGNYKAEVHYVDVMMKLLPNFDCIRYYERMIQKIGHKLSVQQFTLHIAMQYFLRNEDVKNAVIHFAKAIKIDPEGRHLKGYYNHTIDHQNYNIFSFIREKVLPKFDEQYQQIPDELEDTYKYLKNLTT